MSVIFFASPVKDMLIARYSLFESRQDSGVDLTALKTSITEQYCEGKGATGEVTDIPHQGCKIRNLVESGTLIHFVVVLTTTEAAKTQVNTAMQKAHKMASFTDFNLEAQHISGKHS